MFWCLILLLVLTGQLENSIRDHGWESNSGPSHFQNDALSLLSYQAKLGTMLLILQYNSDAQFRRF